MLEEPKIKKVDKRDKQLPQNFEQLIEMYDVEKIWPFFSKIVKFINKIIRVNKDADNKEFLETDLPINAPSFNGKLNGTNIGGRNYLLDSKKKVKMVKPSSNYNRYIWNINHPACLKRLTTDKQYTLSFKFIPEVDGYVPMQCIVVGGIDGLDAWQIRLLPSYFEVENCGDYFVYSHTFTIPGNGTWYLQDHIGFILESSSTNIGGQVYEVKLEEGANKTDWTPAQNDLHSNYLIGEIVAAGDLSNSTTSVSASGSTVSLLLLYHYFHGSCGGAYILFKGANTGNTIATIKDSAHASITYENDVINITADSWGVSYRLIKLL